MAGLLRLDSLRDEGAFRTWIATILHRTWLNQRKRRTETIVDQTTIERVVALGNPDPERLAIARRVGSRVEEALRTLPDEQRIPLLLVDGQGFKYSEVATILDIRPGTAASRVARARIALRALLADVALEQGVTA
jgi:RNA polymerase sigma-70 factor (ECF subfamily)